MKFLHAGYPANFINDTFFRFNEEIEEQLLTKWLFDKKNIVVIRLPFVRKN